MQALPLEGILSVNSHISWGRSGPLSPPPPPGRGEAGLKARYYQKRIAELEEALRRAEKGQRDDDIPALIRAVKPTMEVCRVLRNKGF